MPTTGFKDQIEERLKSLNLNREQICHFAWLCAVRALPFLGAKKIFSYWPENNKQEHLCNIFYAIDVSIRRDWKKTLTVARAAARAGSGIDDADHVACAAYATARAAAEEEDAAAFAAFAAYSAAAAAAANGRTFKKIIDNDIEAIKNNNLDALENDMSIYGEVWHNFLEGLHAINCNYWARLYENLFKNKFAIDVKELERRLNVPDEIRAEGAAAVWQYMERLGQNTESLNEARIIILGERGAGKTSIARKLIDINADLPREDESTEGVTTSIWSFPDKDGNKNVNAHIWDFAGHSITHSAHRCFMSARCLYIYVYNGRIERDKDPTYWLEQIRIHGGDSPVLFLINEKDSHRADIAEKTLKFDYPSIAGYYRLDIGNKEDTTKLEAFCQIVMETVRDNPAWNSQAISAEAYKITHELRERFDKEKSPHISREDFDAIALKHGASTEHIENVLADLHTLGICLWYNKPEMEYYSMLVLNPDWITNGIYRLINKGFYERKHKLSVADGVRMLQDDKRYEYPSDQVEYLFSLMQLYELAFFKKEDKHVFIPGILPSDQPDDLPTFDEGEGLTISLNVEKALPLNIVSRVIVQRNEHKEIFDEKLLWRKGAVLKYHGSDAATAVIKEDGLRIVIDVIGEAKTAYISSLHETLRKIFEAYKGISSKFKYKILLPDELKEELHPILPPASTQAQLVPENVISAHVNKNIPHLEPISQQSVSLSPTAVIYNYNITYNIETNTGTIAPRHGDSAQTTYNIEIRDCVINLQEGLNGIARDLRKHFADDADFMEQIATTVEEIQQTVASTTKAELGETLKKKGLIAKLKEFYDEFTDEKSNLNKNVAKLRNGAEKLKKIGRVYNELAGMIPLLPKIPFI